LIFLIGPHYNVPNVVKLHIKTIMHTTQLLSLDRKRPVFQKIDEEALLREYDEGLKSSSHHNSTKNRKEKLQEIYKTQQYATPSVLNALYKITSNLGDSRLSQSAFETNGQSMSQADLTKFQQDYNLPQQSAGIVGGNNVSQAECAANLDSCAEGNLDIQYMMAIAQNTKTIMWSMPSSPEPFTTWLLHMASLSNPPSVISISWGGRENLWPSSYLDLFSTRAISLSAMGVTITVASGDDGAPGTTQPGQTAGTCPCSVDSSSSALAASAGRTPSNTWTGTGYFPSFPATNPWVVSVGATMGPDTTLGAAEVACDGNLGGVITSGGGFSTYYPVPTWQRNAVSNYIGYSNPAQGYNPQGRGYPDVSFLGRNYPTIIGGTTHYMAGTSASSPLFAAMISLINAIRLRNGKRTLGKVYSAYFPFTS